MTTLQKKDTQCRTRLCVVLRTHLRGRLKGDPAINTHTLGEGRMKRGLLAQLSPHEQTTLRRIATGGDR